MASVISKALKITGELESTEDIQIDGQIEGDVRGVGVKLVGPTLSLHTGSVRKRWPSISSRIVECPSQVTRNPEGGGAAKRPGSTTTVLGADAGATLGSGCIIVTSEPQMSFTMSAPACTAALATSGL